MTSSTAEGQVKIAEPPIQALRQRVNLLVDSLHTMQRRCDELSRHEANARSQQQDLSAQLNTLTQERDQLSAERDALQNESDTFSAQIQTLTGQCQELTSQSQQLSRQLEMLSAHSDGLQQERNLVNSELDALRAIEKELAVQNQELGAQFESLSGQRDNLQHQRDTLQAERDNLQVDLEALSCQLQTLTIENQELIIQRNQCSDKADTATTQFDYEQAAPGQCEVASVRHRGHSGQYTGDNLPPNDLETGKTQSTSASKASPPQVTSLVLRLASQRIAQKDNAYIHNPPQNLEQLAQEACLALSPFRFGPLFHKRENDLIGMSIATYGEWAQNELELLLSFISKGSVVLDVGAYIGSHARAFSSAVGASGSVHCIEPNKNALNVLWLNAAIAEYSNIQVYPMGAASGRKDMHLITSLGNMGATSMRLHSSDEGCQKAECLSLDSMLSSLDALDLIKLDIEGMEAEALKGADGLIEQFEPVIYAEINTVAASADLISWAKDRGYKAWGCLHEAFSLSNFNGEEGDIFKGAKECGLLLASSKAIDIEPPITPGTTLFPVHDIDDVARILARKPQYMAP